MAMSEYLENKLLDQVCRNQSYTPPSTVYLALYSTPPTDTTSGTELSGSGYSRQSISFGAASAGNVASTGNVTFGPASGNWSTVTSIALVDASTSGNILFYKNIASQSVKSGNSLIVESGTLIINLE